MVRNKTAQSGALITANGIPTIQALVKELGGGWRFATDRANLDPDRIYEIDEFVDLSQMAQLLEDCALTCDDDAFGLKMGTRTPIGTGSVFDYVALTASSLDRALDNWVRFQSIPSQSIPITRERDPEITYLHWHISDSLGPRAQLVGAIIGFAANRLKHMANDEALPLRVELTHKPSANISAYHELLGDRIRFGAAADRIGVPHRYLSAVPPDSEPNLLTIMERTALNTLDLMEKESDQLFIIANQVTSGLKDGNASLDAVARDLGMSRRSVQRVLEKAGTTYRELMDDVRKSLAERYLMDSDLQLGEIAYLLGYSELSAFSRSAKGWFGMSAKDYRKRKSASGG
ncbi:AraC family transcriptional regulator ligand-binding domain-containing protein [Roseibium sp.]|uniref:AraC family transcriptional regulator n=1 Tax=Roseibium sp. TaxID=1936156 RepID=UPI003A981EBD